MSNTPDASSVSGEHAVPEAAMDYCFLTKDGSDTSLAVLVIKDLESRATLAHPALCKGRLRGDAVGQAVASIRRLDHHQRVLLKTDTSPRWLTCGGRSPSGSGRR
eukprot:792318-Alexandrium_andersonii.AAC.1